MSSRLLAGLVAAIAFTLFACEPARAPAAPEAREIAGAPSPGVDTLTTSETGLVDVAAGQAPTTTLAAGSVYLATVVAESEHDADSRVVTVWEWDVAGGRPLRKVRLPLDSPNAMPGTVRIATSSARVYVTTELVGGGAIRLTVMNRDLETTATRIVGTGQDVSLEADERSIAVAFRPADSSDVYASHLLRVVLYDPASLRLVAQTELGATSMFSGLSLPDALELHAGRLYVVAVPLRNNPPPRNRDLGALALGETTVFALDLPSLRVARTYVSDASPH